MKILVCNNRVQGGSGIDAMVDLEVACLEQLGHEVSRFERQNEEFSSGPMASRFATWLQVFWPTRWMRRLDGAMVAFGPDVVHVHNTFPLLTRFVYEAVRRHPRCVLVQSLHNYRAVCPQSYTFRAGRSCELCRGRAFLPCLAFRCYRNSFAASGAAVALRWAEYLRGRPLGVDADLFLAVSRHVAEAHVRFGLPRADMHVLANAAFDPGATASGMEPSSDKLVYVGAMLGAKGIWRLLPLAAALPEMELHVIGDGPERKAWTAAAHGQGLRNVTAHGHKPPAEAASLRRDAFLTLVPSIWDEPFGLSAAESLSMGIPVVTTGAGGLAEIVRDGTDGMVNDFTDSLALAREIRALRSDPSRYASWRAAARCAYEERFSPDAYRGRLDALLQGPVTRLIQRA